MKTISSQEQLPDYIRIITSRRVQDTDMIFINATNSDGAILLELDANQVALLTTATFRKQSFTFYFELTELLQSANYHRVDEYSVSEDLLSILNQKSRTDREKVMGGGSQSEKSFISLIKDGYEKGASDIHIIRGPEEAEIKFRIDGRIRPQIPWNVHRADNVVPVAYNSLGIQKELKWTMERYQDADMLVGFPSDDKLIQVKLRYTHSPLKDENTWKATLRILDQTVQVLNISSLGYSETQVQTINRMLLKHTGLTLLAGTTGAGKTTTIASLLTKMHNDENGEIMIHTVEDPPEYTIPNVIQTPLLTVRDKNDPPNVNFFAKAVRNIMRQDPDVIVIGEIRDEATAKAAVHAVQSGHRVLATIHAADAFGVIARLEQLGIDRETLCDPTFIGGIIYQKLIPCLMTTKYTLDTSNKEMMGQFYNESQLAIFSDLLDGIDVICTKNTEDGESSGIKGRTLAAEVLSPTLEMLNLWKEGKIAESMVLWKESGGQFAIDHALEKVRAGQICPADALLVYSEGVMG